MSLLALRSFVSRPTAFVALSALLSAPAVGIGAEIVGAGASFPAPLYAKWAEAYNKATGTRVNYQSVGSGAGLKQIQGKTVDFGASDMPLTPEALAKDGLIQFPTVIGGVVPVVNVPGIKPGELKLTGPLLADIYLGKIKQWNDPAIANLNPGVKLPDQAIATVNRADGSGTTFIFTNYLSKVSPEWKAQVGEGTSVKWVGGLGGKGNEGVSAFLQRVPGAIGYVEYAYAKQNKLSHVLLKNADGQFVAPSAESFKAAAASAKWENGFYEILTEEPGKESWPITGATFILLHKVQDKPENGAETIKFFNWALKKGGEMADQLDYVPLPAPVVGLIEKQFATIKDASGKVVASAN
jgi:phosphate transport system substrate-binding protein